jgi:glucose-6-phosphate isomerase
MHQKCASWCGDRAWSGICWLWLSIGLSIALSIGYDRFIELLEAAHSMDQHFQKAPLDQNMPVILALIGIWYINLQSAETHAIIPYDQAMHQFPSFLQQLDMESNGKSVDIEGNPISYAAGPIVWGETGSNGQHAFFQLLHPGTRFVPIDFIATLRADEETADHHFALLTNMLAQANAFMNGDAGEGKQEFASTPGNRPSNILKIPACTRMTPFGKRLYSLSAESVFRWPSRHPFSASERFRRRARCLRPPCECHHRR